MKTKAKPIPFAGSQLDDTRHVYAFFNSAEEGYRVLLPFIKDGFECGDKAVHVINPDQHCNHLLPLKAAGIDTTAMEHPMIIIGGFLQRNPFFIPLEEFLPELRERRGGQAKTPAPAS